MTERTTESRVWRLVVPVAVGAGCALLVLAVSARAPHFLWALPLVPLVVAGGIFAISAPEAILLVLVAFTAFEFAGVLGAMGSSLSIFKILSPIAIGVLLLRYVLGLERPLRFDALDRWLALWILFSAALIPVSLDPDLAQRSVVRTMSLALWYVALSRFFANRPWQRRLGNVVIAANTMVVLGGLYNYMTSTTTVYIAGGPRRFSLMELGPGSQNVAIDPNILCLILYLPLSLAAARMLSTRKGRPLMIAVTGILTFAILLTYSRSGFLVLAVATIIFLFRARVSPVRILVLSGLIVTAPLASQQFRERLMTLVEGEAHATDKSMLVRSNIWRVAGNIIEDRPLYGVGPGNFPYAHSLDQYQDVLFLIGDWRLAHNLFLDMAGETGILGLILFLGLVSTALLRITKLARHEPPDEYQAKGLWLSFLTFLVMSLTLSTYAQKVFWLQLAWIRALSETIDTRPRWAGDGHALAAVPMPMGREPYFAMPGLRPDVAGARSPAPGDRWTA